MDRESLYGSRVRYEERLCAVDRAVYALRAPSDQTDRGWWPAFWLSGVKNLVARCNTPVISNDAHLRTLAMTIPVQENAYNTWLCLRTRGERL